MHGDEESSSLQSRRGSLPQLAPRQSQGTSSRDRSSGSGSGRPPRLSHRSRAGCWTCRARKVKCDEVHPKCGPCTRLNRDCDWDHRWNFSDATSSTQVKHSNVKTAGNTVWDPEARPTPDSSPGARQYDDLPAFSALSTDDERERKAETQRPGTFGVVVTPESFSELPEYASTSSPGSRRMSIQSQTSRLSTNTPPPGRLPIRVRTDPNVVVLDRFEDVSPPSAGAFSIPSPERRPSLPNGFQFLSLSGSNARSQVLPNQNFASTQKPNDQFLARFRHHIASRLFQPQLEGASPDMLSPGSTRDAFELEAGHFQPLRHAICAISALNLAQGRNSSLLAEAMQHYHQAVSAQTNTTSTDDLLSDGVFLRHFLLFIYDICIQMPDDHGDAELWPIHLTHLQRIASLRNERLQGETHGYLIWLICELDMYACLLGSGSCDFVRLILEHRMLPPREQQIPSTPVSLPGPFLRDEATIFPHILALNEGIVLRTAKLAQTAQTFRHQASQGAPVSPGVYARWQAAVSQQQSDLNNFWLQACPDFLDPENPLTAAQLPSRVKYVFEHAFVLYQAAMIYSRTSMFPSQRRIPIANQQELQLDTERRIMSIIAVATTQLENGQLDRRHIIFPLFMAGFATSRPDIKIQALDIIKSYEGAGIGQNTYRTRQLLSAVYEEQRRVANAGGRMEDVDWLRVARERSLTVVNCGL